MLFTRIVYLTPEQKEFAEEHHALVYRFLYDRHLNVEQFYDVVVFAYQQAVKKYDEDRALKKYAFSTIAWRRMEAAVGNYWRSRRCAARNAIVFSLDAPVHSKTVTKWDGTEICDPIAELESKLMLSHMYARLNEDQRRLVGLRMSGAADDEIAQKLHISQESIDEQFGKMQELLADCV